VACFILEKLEDLANMQGLKQRRAVIGNDANQPVFRHFNTGNHSVSDMEMRAFCPISGINDSAKVTKYPRFQTWHCPPPSYGI
jgi:hypothetical protein